MPRYRNARFRQDANGKRYYIPTVVPNIPINDSDIYINPQVGERFDSLAQKFYGDSNLWWIIAKANDMANGQIAISNETKIRIPMNIQPILSTLETNNS